MTVPLRSNYVAHIYSFLAKDAGYGYKTGPEEMAKLDSDDKARLAELKIANSTLKSVL